MDAYEATRVVFSRIQTMDPDNAAKIMGLLLIQDHGEKEMIRLAFGPDSLLHSVVLKARKDLGLLPPSPSPFLARQTYSSRLPPPPLTVTSPSWHPHQQPFSRFANGSTDDLPKPPADELLSPVASSPFFGGGGGGGGDLLDDFQLQDQLSFLNDHSGNGPKPGDLVYPEDCQSPSAGGDPMLLPYGMGWGQHLQHRRSCSVSDICLSDPAGFGWRPCLYYARGYCKNGSSCRFVHGLPEDANAASKMDAAVEQLLFRSKSQRLSSSASQLLASADAFPYSPTGSVPQSPSASSKCMDFLLQQQQTESQRAAAAAAAAAALMLGGDEAHKYIGRSPRMERADFAGMVNPGSRQIYLTFPADSTFSEEDVSNYFSIYGPVQDVRIPYQQKRMFGFVTFVYPETVKLILAKGNPHFVCDSRVLVKPYKEKGKVPDKYRNKQLSERGDFSGCSTPTGLDPRDPFDLQLGPRMLYGGSCSSQDLLLRRKLEEQQQQQQLQHAIELQGRRFMGLHLLDLKSRSFSSSMAPPNVSAPLSPSLGRSTSGGGSRHGSPPTDKSSIAVSGAAISRPAAAQAGEHELDAQTAVNDAAKEESGGRATPNVDSGFQESSLEHNLPDSPFASPTKSSILSDSFSLGEADSATAGVASPTPSGNHLIGTSLLPPSSTLDMASFKSCFFQMPRFSSGHGAVGM